MEIISFNTAKEIAVLDCYEQAVYGLPDRLALDSFISITAVSRARRERAEQRLSLARAALAVPESADKLLDYTVIMDDARRDWQVDAAVELHLVLAGIDPNDSTYVTEVDDYLE
ncbi:MAG TPA: hypothetical protein VLG92_05860 [Candidatus Saccharimonadia bacterium]|nr:hypothetical protein [Candidatus Saccharimonadia bacterium]